VPRPLALRPRAVWPNPCCRPTTSTCIRLLSFTLARTLPNFELDPHFIVTGDSEMGSRVGMHDQRILWLNVK
jgi:hypothetical protein